MRHFCNALKPPNQVVSESTPGAVQTVRLTEGGLCGDRADSGRQGIHPFTEEFENPGWREGHTSNMHFVSQDLEEGKILTWPTLEPVRRWTQQAGQGKEECKEGAKGRGDREREFPGWERGSLPPGDIS